MTHLTPLLSRHSLPLELLRTGLGVILESAFAEPSPRKSEVPPLNIFTEEEGLVIELPLPGAQKYSIAVTYQDQTISISGERKNNHPGATIVSGERSFGRFERQVQLLDSINAAGITSTYRDGILRVVVPKPAKAEPVKVAVA